MNTAGNFPLQTLHMCSIGLHSGEYGGRKIKVCGYFPRKVL